jgi:hypothetical protein
MKAPVVSLFAIALLIPASVAASDLGRSVTANIAAQTAAEPNSAQPLPGGSGQRTVDADQRNLTGNVKALLKMDGKATLGVQGGATDLPTTAKQ